MNPSAKPGPGPIQVVLGDSAEGRPLEFAAAFRIGRGAGCEVRVSNEFVSRVHAEVAPTTDGWLIRDLNSSNGLYHQGLRVDHFLFVSQGVIRLGVEGPELSFRVLTVPEPEAFAPVTSGPDSMDKHNPSAGDDSIVARYAERYFRRPAPGEQVGEHTMYLRRAFAQVQTQQRTVHRRQRWVFIALIGMLTAIGIGASGYAYMLRRQVIRQRELAHTLFYSLKSLDVEIAKAERLELTEDKQRGRDAVDKYETRRKQMQANYDQFLSTLHIYDQRTTEQHRLILRIARIFGECELDMPSDF